MKSNRRKILSHRRIRTSKSFSNCSLSQILQIASYKKQINDLSRNNRHVTTALQESIIKCAVQDDLLKNYAKDANQILFARIKLNEMAKNLAKFATDLEEVRSCLDIDGPTEYDFFRKKGSSSGKISKVPDMSCIEEMPEFSENENTSSENSDILQSSSKESLDFINADTEMTPVILADDIELQEKLTNDADRKSVHDADRKSEADINLGCVTQRRLTRSSGKISLCKNDSSTFKELDIHVNDLTPSLRKKQKTIKTETLTSSSLASKIEDDSENASIIVQSNCDESLNINSHDCSSIKSDVKKCSKTSDIATNEYFDLNHSAILCENNDSNEKNKSLKNESNLPFEADVEEDSEIHSILEEKKNYVNDELSPKKDSQKFSEGLLNTSSTCHDVQLPEISEYDDEIQNVGSLTFCESNDDDDDEEIQNVGELTFCEPNKDEEEIQNAATLTSCKPNDDEKNKNVDASFSDPSHNDDEIKNAVSPYVRSSRSKKPVKYADYFLPEEFSPPRLSAEKSKTRKNVKRFSFEKNKPDEMISAGKNDIDSEVENPESNFSVYNLDVSNSKMAGKKTKKKLKHKKTNEDIPKPLFNKCSVTKLKAGNFKFGKLNEISSELKNVNKHSEKTLQNYCASPGGILKKVQCKTPQIFENSKNEVVDMIDVESHLDQIVLQTPKSASKKVSFAPTDLVCSFVKMAESKTIADNRKVRRTSKSCLDFKELFKEEDSEEEDREETKTPPVNADNFSENADVRKSNNSDISVSTKLCTVALPSNENIPSDVPLEFCVSEQIQLLSNDNNKLNKNSSGTPNSPKSSKRLSLKGNKVTRAAESHVSSLTLKEADILFLESPVAVLKRPKRISLFKESTDDNSEEHTNSDHLALDKKNSLKEKTHINEISSPILNIAIKTSSYSKCENEIPSNVSIRKNKKSNPEIALERSSVLIDSTNLTEGNTSRRRSKQVSYKEPNLLKKLRRE